jgi:mannosylglycerate hydrolase
VKETDDGRGWIVRGYNIGDEEISISLTPWQRFKKAERANMAEEKVGRLKVESSGGVAVKARGHEVVTVMFSK